VYDLHLHPPTISCVETADRADGPIANSAAAKARTPRKIVAATFFINPFFIVNLLSLLSDHQE